MKIPTRFIAVIFASGLLAAHGQEEEQQQEQQQEQERVCSDVAAEVIARVQADRIEVLNIVSEEVGQNPRCSCEIVTIAIRISEADKALVGEIVYVAIMAAPDQMSLIAQCALAEAPDAAAEINAAVRRAGGEDSFNPLDFPGGIVPSNIGLNKNFFNPNRGRNLITDPNPFTIILRNFPNIFFQQ